MEEGREVMFTPPATLRIKAAGSRRELFEAIQDVLRELS